MGTPFAYLFPFKRDEDPGSIEFRHMPSGEFEDFYMTGADLELNEHLLPKRG